MATGRANRVAPDGTLHVTTARGTVFGNRGALLSARGELARPWRERRWIACELHFRGRRRQQWRPNTYTELYFLDEATALAAGHRPCAECRRPAYRAFSAAFARVTGADRPPTAPALDDVLHRDRLGPDGAQRTHLAPLADLPAGVVVVLDGRWWSVTDDALRPWSFDGYGTARPRAGVTGPVEVLTPSVTVAVLRAGYRPQTA